jgi:putative membrane protein
MFKRARKYWSVVFALFKRDVLLVVKNPIAIVVVLGMLAMPSAYAWYVIEANWDPYNNTSNMKVAVANEDEGYTSDELGTLAIGESVVDKLKDNHSIGWEFTNEEDAINGVYEGTYWAAIVIPKDFSKNFASVITGTYTQPTLEYYVNEKSSSIAPKVTDAAATTVQRTINKAFVEDASVRIITATQKLGSQVSTDADSAQDTIASSLTSIDDTLAKTQTTLTGLSSSVDETADAVKSTNEKLATLQSDVPKITEELSGVKSDLKSTRADVNKYGPTVIKEASNTAQEALDDLIEATSILQGKVAGLTPTIKEDRALLTSLSDTLDTSRDALAATSSTLSSTRDSLTKARNNLGVLQSSSLAKVLDTYLGANAEDIGSFLASPVSLQTELIYPVKNYGSGVAPFFTNLALWVAGFVLMAMVKLRVDPKGVPPFTDSQAYWGRWLFYVSAGLIMGLVCCVGDLALGIQCESPAAFIAAGLLTVFVDVNLMYGLAYAFRHVGKAFAVILLIMQIPGSSGMFPIEMMPAFFQTIHPFLPFTYSIDAMREAIGGFYGLNYLFDMLILAVFFVPAGFIIGLGFGRLDSNLTSLFDSKLKETDLFVTEPGTVASDATFAARTGRPGKASKYQWRALMGTLLDTDTYRASIIEKATTFQRRYPLLRRIGWVLLVLQPLVTFALMVVLRAAVDVRLEMLLAMVVGIVAVDAYLIFISYADTSITYELALAKMSTEELQQQVRRNNRGKNLAKNEGTDNSGNPITPSTTAGSAAPSSSPLPDTAGTENATVSDAVSPDATNTEGGTPCA